MYPKYREIEYMYFYDSAAFSKSIFSINITHVLFEIMSALYI